MLAFLSNDEFKLKDKMMFRSWTVNRVSIVEMDGHLRLATTFFLGAVHMIALEHTRLWTVDVGQEGRKR